MACLSILVVEDEAVIAMDLQDLLEGLGYHVPIIATTAHEAFDAIAAHQPDLILLDIRLADGSSGIEVAEQVQKKWAIPVVFLTAHADADTIARAEATGPYHYLLKPFNDREVAIAVRLALAKSVSDRQLRASEQRYATTLQSIADAVIVADADQRVTFLNPAATQITGWSEEEAAGRPLPEIVPIQGVSDMQPIDQLAAQAMAQRIPVALPPESVLLRRDGSLRQVTDSLAPIADDQGTISGTVLIMQDVTEQRQAEATQRRMERKLQETQRLESLGMMAGGIAHDFNNLLATITGYTEMALSDLAPNTEPYDMLVRAMNGLQRASDLTRQMLTYAGKGKLLMVPLDLNELVHDTADLMRVSIGAHGQLRLRLAPALPPVDADATQVHQVVLNLLTNAAEALSDPGDTIALTTQVVTLTADDLRQCIVGDDQSPGSYVALAVQDTGVGMDAATQARMFDPFFSTKFTGRGLGLAAVMGIVRGHRGALQVQSAPGQGTIMRVFLPVSAIPIERPVPQPGGAAVQRQMIVQAQPLGYRGRILLIDDDPDVRGVATRMLERLGFIVHSAADGPTGLQLLQSDIADLRGVLLDLTMPIMSGPAVAQAIKTLRPDLPIVLTSGYPAEEVSRQFSGLGLQCFLQKPFTRSALASALGAVLITNEAD